MSSRKGKKHLNELNASSSETKQKVTRQLEDAMQKSPTKKQSGNNRRIEDAFGTASDRSFASPSDSGSSGSAYGMNAETFEDIKRKEEAKQHFLTIMNEQIKGSRSKNTSDNAILETLLGCRPGPDKPPKINMVPAGACSKETTSAVDNRIQVIYSDVPEKWHQKIVDYLNKHWDNTHRLNSVRPILARLEQEFGPQWCIDQIYGIRNDDLNIVPGSTINFCVLHDPRIYSLWRRELPK